MARDGIGGVSAADSPAVDELANLSRLLLAQGDMAEGIVALEQALVLAPHRADLHAELGNFWQALNEPETALRCYRRAIAVDPNCIAARQNLGYLLGHLGEPTEALAHYEHALSIRPTPMTHMLASTVLPVIYQSRDELEWWRARLTKQVRALADQGLRVDTSRSQAPTSFHLAYQAENDRELAADFGRIYQGVELRAVGRPEPRLDGRLRIGFLSSFFHDHTIGRLNLGRVRWLSRAHFEVVVLSVGHVEDEWSRSFSRAADRYVVLPRHVEAARELIAEQDLDVLVFADVGMDAITSTLAFSRMAPVQCVAWGHPDTTGSPAVDFFLSSELLETTEADGHYTEQLVRLPKLAIGYSRPVRTGPRRTPAYFGLREGRHHYACLQTLYKFHPDFDELLARILTADPAGDLVLLAGRMPTWTEQLRQRFRSTLPDADRRVIFLPPQPYDDYLALLESADVVLDPQHFGGGNSSYEALAMGAGVVTLPSAFLRGRITQALYRQIGYEELIAGSSDAYVHLAVRLACDTAYRAGVREQIRSRSDVLFDNPEEIRGLDEFMWSLTG